MSTAPIGYPSPYRRVRKRWTIAHCARWLGMPATTLQSWLDRGLSGTFPPHVTLDGVRYMDPAEVMAWKTADVLLRASERREAALASVPDAVRRTQDLFPKESL